MDKDLKRLSTLKVLSLYSALSSSQRLFLLLRHLTTPYSVLAGYLPEKGLIIDGGAGFGLLALHVAAGSRRRRVLGLDHDIGRIAAARSAAAQFHNCSFFAGSIARFRFPQCTAICAVDVLHYLGGSEQVDFLRRSFEALEPGGVLLVREVDSTSQVRSGWNRFHERVMTKAGFTKARELNFRPVAEWSKLLRAEGFEVRSDLVRPLFPFVDRVLVAGKAGR